MLLFKTDPGQLVDRQTILELKIEHSNVEFEPEKTDIISDKRGSRVLQRTVVNKNALGTKIHLFFDELELIQKALLEKWIPDIYNSDDKVKSYDELYEQLSEVNSQLWDLEDQIRILRDAPDKFEELAAKRAAEVAFAIADLNDKRAGIVKQFNSLWNVNTEEKQYC